MKHTLLLILFINVTGLFVAKAQITYEHTYPMLEYDIQLNDIGGNQYKYMYVDYSANTLKLFNLDHSEYADIEVPVTLDNGGEYSVSYVTKGLFDCDTSTLEYAIFPNNWRNTFYICREDGTILFEQDSTLSPYCFGCYNGSYDTRPIVSTPEGAKMFLAKATPLGLTPTVDVYSLCGELPTQVFDFDRIGAYVKIYPNPSFGQLNFEINPPVDSDGLQLSIAKIDGGETNIYSVDSFQSKTRINVPNLSAGTYIYYLKNADRIYQTGKFIINK